MGWPCPWVGDRGGQGGPAQTAPPRLPGGVRPASRPRLVTSALPSVSGDSWGLVATGQDTVSCPSCVGGPGSSLPLVLRSSQCHRATGGMSSMEIHDDDSRARGTWSPQDTQGRGPMTSMSPAPALLCSHPLEVPPQTCDWPWPRDAVVREPSPEPRPRELVCSCGSSSGAPTPGEVPRGTGTCPPRQSPPEPTRVGPISCLACGAAHAHGRRRVKACFVTRR